jgi:phosphonate transport system permease protein
MWRAEGGRARQTVFARRKRLYTLTLLGITAFYLLASAVVEYNALDGFEAVPRAFTWIVHNLVPTEKALTRLPHILDKLLETTLLSISVTVTAAVCAFFFSLLGSKTTKINGTISRVVRIIAAFFRNVPDVVWAMLLLFSFGQNILTGFFALFFTSFGMLTRTFIETIDEVSASCTEALYATGATFMQTVFQGIIPSAVSEIVTWVLFMIETNIRSSTLIGMLTATGIGYLFDLYYKRLDYGSASLVVLCIVITVILIETISSRIRRVIL